MVRNSKVTKVLGQSFYKTKITEVYMKKDLKTSEGYSEACATEFIVQVMTQTGYDWQQKERVKRRPEGGVTNKLSSKCWKTANKRMGSLV